MAKKTKMLGKSSKNVGPPSSRWVEPSYGIITYKNGTVKEVKPKA